MLVLDAFFFLCIQQSILIYLLFFQALKISSLLYKVGKYTAVT